MESGFAEYSDVNRVFSIAAPEAVKTFILDEAPLSPATASTKFSWVILQGEGLVVKINCTRLEQWHEYANYNQARTREEYAREAIWMHEERYNKRFGDQAKSRMQWDKEMMRKEIPGGYISIRLATWWGEDVVPHSFTLFTAVSPAWIVTGTIEEDVPRSTGEIVTSFAFLPAAAHSEKTLIETHANNWD